MDSFSHVTGGPILLYSDGRVEFHRRPKAHFSTTIEREASFDRDNWLFDRPGGEAD